MANWQAKKDRMIYKIYFLKLFPTIYSSSNAPTIHHPIILSTIPTLLLLLFLSFTNQKSIMMPSTSFSSIPQEIVTKLHYSRRLLLHSPLFHFDPSPPTTQAPAPTYQVLEPDSNHGKTGFDSNIVLILAVLVCALICSLCINSVIKFVIKCVCMITGGPNYLINPPNEKKKVNQGLDKRALKTFPVVKYSKEVEIQGLGTECVICLSEFKGGEKVRILPKCHHGFHVKCIDKWLNSHSSCPTCRQSLVETCQKIIGYNDQQQATTTTTTTTTSSTETVVVTIVPLEREEVVRDYRGDNIAQS